MTLTTPACPVAASMPGEVETAIRTVPGVDDVRVKLVWSPPWGPERMSEEARLELGML
jgi:metal-sulfur cluster biosynthetic enzyme